MSQQSTASQAESTTAATDVAGNGLRRCWQRLSTRLKLSSKADLNGNTLSTSIESTQILKRQHRSSDTTHRPLNQVSSALVSRTWQNRPSEYKGRTQQLGSSDSDEPLEIMLCRPKPDEFPTPSSQQLLPLPRALPSTSDKIDFENLQSGIVVPCQKSLHISSAAYRYLPLESTGSIRLLELLPGCSHEVILCRLFHSSFQDDFTTPDYTALSYVLGPPTPRKMIVCNGHYFPITENLEAALRAVRQPDAGTIMWIDQICINQGDNDERCAQVQIMDRIYSRAKRTIAWWGPSTKRTTIAIEFLSGLLHTLEVIAENAGHDSDGPSNLSTGRERFREQLFVSNRVFKSYPRSDSGWSALREMLELSWFSRVWIIQEALLSCDLIIQWGAEQFPWKTILKFYDMVNPYGQLLNRFISHDAFPAYMLLHIAQNKMTQKRDSMGELLIRSIHQDSTDPRDKVYALLNLASDSHLYHITPDYIVSVNSLYQQTTMAIAENMGLDFLNQGLKKPPDQRFPGLASWSLDFIYGANFGLVLPAWHYNASAHTKNIARTKLRWSLDSDPNLLILRGKIVDSVGQQSVKTDRYPFGDFFDSSDPRFWEYFIQIADFLDRCKQIATLMISDPSCKNEGGQLWRTLISDIGVDLHKASEAYAECFNDFEAFIELAKNCTSNGSFAAAVGVWSNERLGRLQRWHRVFDDAGWGCQFIATAAGRLGWVPLWAQEGDAIAVVYGSRVPWVLRQAENNRWQRLGTCYIEGVMYG